MRCRSIAILLALLAGSAPPVRPQIISGALPRSTAATSAAAGTAALEGTVVDAQTGEPVRKAEVTAIWSGRDRDNSDHEPQSVASDASGHFIISGLPTGKYRLRIEANRFAAQSYGESRFGGRGKDVEVAAGQRVTGLDVRLIPCGVITGAVHDENGDPVEGAMVQSIPVGRRRGFQGGNQVQTNDLGQYRLYNLAPGQYLVQVSLQRPEDQQLQAAQQAYVPMFYPDVTDPSTAATITVDAGAETQGIDIDVRPVHAVRISGRVVNDSSARSTQNAYVMLMPAAADPHRRLRAVAMMTASRYAANVEGPRGEFVISGVPAGSYWATANLQDDQRQYQGRVLVQVGDADVQGVTIPVSAGVNLAGHVRVDPQRPFDYSKLAVVAIPADGGPFGGQGARVGPDGSFTLENLMAGNYRLRVSGFPEEYYLKAVRFGGGDVLETGLSVDSSSASAQLDVLLSAGGSTISGTVINDEKPSQATVFLVPDPPRRDREDLYSVKRTQADGSFSLLGLPPGDFKLFAFEDPDPGLMSDPSLLQPYESKGTSVHLEEGQKQTVRLELIPSQE
jgi:protocatechuate 3,4-dioxygenase beta subunit